ncbi:adenosine monophosphate deaminase 2 [Cryptosporidium ubiquitum]|uniref:AMP deaminase n=1 Tax=Cryptosporidium ubiquitum TaxID=857276 RepID=A0A1J4MG65_9CRYT|nr:adenosine monophosphate deaminase 2 [Cryptosporidium ubiquitum]OII72012.1 adenosine monophosphate deaminase 2 [Cryptosporidium ubiquitum]
MNEEMTKNNINVCSMQTATYKKSEMEQTLTEDPINSRESKEAVCPLDEFLLFKSSSDSKIEKINDSDSIEHDSVDLDDNSIDYISNPDKTQIEDLNFTESTSSRYSNADYNLKKSPSNSTLDEFNRWILNDELETEYVKLIPNSEIVFAKSYDKEMNIAIGLIDEVLKMRDEWNYELPMIEHDHLIIHNYGHLQDGNPVLDIESILETLPGKIDVKYEMINGIYNIKWYSNKNLIYNPITFKKIKKTETMDLNLSYELDGFNVSSGKCLNIKKSFPLYETESKSVHEFIRCLRRIMSLVHSPIVKSFTYYRLKFLLQSYQLYSLFNGKLENELSKKNIRTGFYNVYKVDTHVHHSACMSQQHLLKFIRKCYNSDKDRVVFYNRENVPSTLGQVFSNVFGCDYRNNSIDHLNMDAIRNCFQRFDRFNEKYNPFGSNLMRDIFLKYNNSIKGKYLADITKEVIQDLKNTHYQYVEWRISVYGKDKNEWKTLSEWFYYNGLYCKHVRWIIQIPRLYNVFYKDGYVKSFSELLENIFSPLIEALINPKENPFIFILLSNIVGWDTVDDESQLSKYSMNSPNFCYPEYWKSDDNPPYSYWGFYLYSNIRVLNQLLYSRGLNPLKFRPHCGEAGKISHLATMYLLADSINHGILLKKTPVLQYLYYLKQIGIAVSPVSNNALFLELMKNPFPKFFNVGLNVSLSTDDPLIFHFTDESLLEEYSIASHIWKLNNIDLCEIARNSVLQSGFSPKYKASWLGIKNYNHLNKSLYNFLNDFEPCEINDISRSNVPNIRIQFRKDMLKGEMDLINKYTVSIDRIENAINIVKNLRLKNVSDNFNKEFMNSDFNSSMKKFTGSSDRFN